jgi:hypothetical protein
VAAGLALVFIMAGCAESSENEVDTKKLESDVSSEIIDQGHSHQQAGCVAGELPKVLSSDGLSEVASNYDANAPVEDLVATGLTGKDARAAAHVIARCIPFTAFVEQTSIADLLTPAVSACLDAGMSSAIYADFVESVLLSDDVSESQVEPVADIIAGCNAADPEG